LLIVHLPGEGDDWTGKYDVPDQTLG